ncbi:MAG: DnaJ domain-containing protein, partial [Magnetospirillum sp.]|nr:DnaJ domain-containing protein [Magnetospirillum sp.]
MRNPYDILGVKRNVGDDEIRKAFRRLAKQCHPDLKPGDKQAEARFRELSAAYELLSDRDKRARFDRGEIDAEGHETFAHAAAGAHGHRRAHPGAGFGFEAGVHPRGADDLSDLFSHLFADRFGGSGGRGAGLDRRHSVTVDFLDAANGARRRITLGDGRSLDVTIPAGLGDGQVLRLKGQGDPGLGGGVAGDLLLEVHVAPHPLFRRDGNTVFTELPVSLAEAIDGGRVPAPTPSGTVTLTVPPGSNSGTRLRLKGKGIKGGDLFVTVKVVLPPE